MCVHVCTIVCVCVCVCMCVCVCLYIRVQKLLMLLHVSFFLFIQLGSVIDKHFKATVEFPAAAVYQVKSLLSRRSTVPVITKLILIPLSCAKKIQAPDSPRKRISCHQSCIGICKVFDFSDWSMQSVNVVAVCTHAWLHD